MNLYREIVILHYKNPKNKGELKFCTHSACKANTMCGDEITIQVVVEDEKIKDVKFNGKGCAISQAASSLMSEHLIGLDVEQAKKLKYEDIVEMLGGGPISPGRIKCAKLGLDVFHEAINSK